MDLAKSPRWSARLSASAPTPRMRGHPCKPRPLGTPPSAPGGACLASAARQKKPPITEHWAARKFSQHAPRDQRGHPGENHTLPHPTPERTSPSLRCRPGMQVFITPTPHPFREKCTRPPRGQSRGPFLDLYNANHFPQADRRERRPCKRLPSAENKFRRAVANHCPRSVFPMMRPSASRMTVASPSWVRVPVTSPAVLRMVVTLPSVVAVPVTLPLGS
jgi:hypothetical protein